jgi:hypothetical protein
VQASGWRHDHQLALDDLRLVSDPTEVFDGRLAPCHIAETTTSSGSGACVLWHAFLESMTEARRWQAARHVDDKKGRRERRPWDLEFGAWDLDLGFT